MLFSPARGTVRSNVARPPSRATSSPSGTRVEVGVGLDGRGQRAHVAPVDGERGERGAAVDDRVFQRAAHRAVELELSGERDARVVQRVFERRDQIRRDEDALKLRGVRRVELDLQVRVALDREAARGDQLARPGAQIRALDVEESAVGAQGDFARERRAPRHVAAGLARELRGESAGRALEARAGEREVERARGRARDGTARPVKTASSAPTSSPSNARPRATRRAPC